MAEFRISAKGSQPPPPPAEDGGRGDGAGRADGHAPQISLERIQRLLQVASERDAGNAVASMVERLRKHPADAELWFCTGRVIDHHVREYTRAAFGTEFPHLQALYEPRSIPDAEASEAYVHCIRPDDRVSLRICVDMALFAYGKAIEQMPCWSSARFARGDLRRILGFAEARDDLEAVLRDDTGGQAAEKTAAQQALRAVEQDDDGPWREFWTTEDPGVVRDVLTDHNRPLHALARLPRAVANRSLLPIDRRKGAAAALRKQEQADEGPSAASDGTWFVASEHKGRPVTQGPLPFRRLLQMVVDGTLEPEMMVCREGTQEWVPAGSLSLLFNSASLRVREHREREETRITYASIWKRLFARGVDLLLAGDAYVILLSIALFVNRLDAITGKLLFRSVFLVCQVAWVAYFVCFEAMQYGGTYGKRLVGICVLSRDSEDTAGFVESLFRTGIRDGWLVGLAMLVALAAGTTPAIYTSIVLSALVHPITCALPYCLTKRRQMLHDIAGGTVVIETDIMGGSAFGWLILLGVTAMAISLMAWMMVMGHIARVAGG